MNFPTYVRALTLGNPVKLHFLLGEFYTLQDGERVVVGKTDNVMGRKFVLDAIESDGTYQIVDWDTDGRPFSHRLDVLQTIFQNVNVPNIKLASFDFFESLDEMRCINPRAHYVRK